MTIKIRPITESKKKSGKKTGRPREIPVFYNLIIEDALDSSAPSQDYLFVLPNKDKREISEMERKLIENIQSKEVLLQKTGKKNKIFYKLLGLRIYSDSYHSRITKEKLKDLFGAAEADKRLTIKSKGIELTLEYIEEKLKKY